MQVQAQCVADGLVQVLATLLSTEDADPVVVMYSATILTKLAKSRGFPEEAQKHGVYLALVHAVINAHSFDALTEARSTVSLIGVTIIGGIAQY